MPTKSSIRAMACGGHKRKRMCVSVSHRASVGCAVAGLEYAAVVALVCVCVCECGCDCLFFSLVPHSFRFVCNPPNRLPISRLWSLLPSSWAKIPQRYSVCCPSCSAVIRRVCAVLLELTTKALNKIHNIHFFLVSIVSSLHYMDLMAMCMARQ